MKVLLYGINFSPELTGIGKYSGELADWLVEQGHDVSVVTAPPYYPDWRVVPPYSSFRYVVEQKGPNYRVTRCPLWVPSVPKGLSRIVHLLSFALSSIPALLFSAKGRPDVIIVVVPAFFCSVGALAVARLVGAKAWIHVQDYEVDAAFDLGILKGEWLKKAALGFEKWVLQRFDRVSTISRKMFELARRKGVEQSRTLLFPNWVDLSIVNNVAADRVAGVRDSLGIPESAVVALYSGNMGAKQGLEILSEAADLLKNEKDIFFIFCGNGAGRVQLEAAVRKFINVHFLDLQPLERFGELLLAADIQLLPQRADAADLVMPSKLTGMLASGRPIVATAVDGTEVALVVGGCGLVVPPEDPNQFASAILSLARDKSLRERLGEAGRRYASDNLEKSSVLSKFSENLKSLCS